VGNNATEESSSVLSRKQQVFSDALATRRSNVNFFCVLPRGFSSKRETVRWLSPLGPSIAGMSRKWIDRWAAARTWEMALKRYLPRLRVKDSWDHISICSTNLNLAYKYNGLFYKNQHCSFYALLPFEPFFEERFTDRWEDCCPL